MDKNIEVNKSGLQCDNPNCDWKDETIELTESLVNTPCPKCGENVLTQEDYENSLKMDSIVEFINTLSPEEIGDFTKTIDVEKLFSSSVFKDTKGLETLADLPEDGIVSMTISMHKDIKIEEIKRN